MMVDGFIEMSASECRARLGRAGVGRVVLCTPGGPEIYPVNFTVVDGDIVFRTAPYSNLGLMVGGKAVAFEVDHLDHPRRSGWSVVVKGDAVIVDDPDDVLRLQRLVPEPWASGQRRLFLRIRAQTMSGRHVRDGG